MREFFETVGMVGAVIFVALLTAGGIVFGIGTLVKYFDDQNDKDHPCLEWQTVQGTCAAEYTGRVVLKSYPCDFQLCVKKQ